MPFELLTTETALARYGHAGVQFNNRMIIAGGYSGSAYLNDVWESVDGKQWNRICNGAASFSARAYHKMIVHDNHIYLIGGTNGSALADVWVSPDGTTWERVSNNNFTARSGLNAWAFDNRIFVCGGINGATYHTDLWASYDGVTWRQLNTGYTRNSRVYAGSLVYDDKMWLLGGYDGTTVHDDSFWSVDGLEWKSGNTAASFGAINIHAACVYDNKMVVMGGNTSGTRATAASMSRGLYYSYTGTEWYQGATDVGFAVQEHVLLTLEQQNRLFVICGFNGTAATGQVWGSVDVRFRDNMI